MDSPENDPNLIGGMRLPPWGIREKYGFFIVYREDPDIPAVQIQLEDGRTYDVYTEDFGRVPQITRLPLWEKCLKLACAEGQSVYILGDTPEQDEVRSVPSENGKNEPVNVTARLRDDAVRNTGITRLRRSFKNVSPRGGSTLRYRQR